MNRYTMKQYLMTSFKQFRVKFLYSIVLIGFLFGCSSLSIAQPSTSTPHPNVTGITLTSIEDPEGPWSVRIIEWDKNLAPTVRLISAKAATLDGERVAALETTSSIAQRYVDAGAQVAGAVNADFFSRKLEPVNRMMSYGDWILSHSDNNRRSVMTIDDEQRLWAGKSNLSMNLCSKIAGLQPPCVPFTWNRPPPPGSAAILNKWFSDTLAADIQYRIYRVQSLNETDLLSATPGTLEFEIALERSEDLQLGASIEIDGTLPRLSGNEKWLVLHGDFWTEPDNLNNLSIESILEGPLSWPIEVIGGGPLLLHQGQIVVDSMAVAEGIGEAFLTTRHPRTAIGWNADQSKIWLVVVDGRQEHSAGMSLQELSRFFIELGATDALNLDGGGSSALVFDGQVRNTPSDPTGERKVTNALLLVY